MYYIIPNISYRYLHLCGYISQYLGIMCVYALYHYKILFFFFFSDFRGPVPAPVTNGLHYFTASELQKNFELCKAPIGPYSERRWVEFYAIKSVILCWLVKIVALLPMLQRNTETGEQDPTFHHGIWRE